MRPVVRKGLWLLAGLAAVICLAVLAFTVWASDAAQPQAAALAALVSDGQVEVSQDPMDHLHPRRAQADRR